MKKCYGFWVRTLFLTLDGGSPGTHPRYMCMESVTCVYCYHNYFSFSKSGMTYDWWRMYITMELGWNFSHTDFFLSNNDIQTKSITKDSGAQFESNLKFKARINDIVCRAHQRSALIYRSFLSPDTYNLILAFKTYVRPLLDYVSPVWSPTHIMLIRSVEVVQRRFTKRGTCAPISAWTSDSAWTSILEKLRIFKHWEQTMSPK